MGIKLDERYIKDKIRIVIGEMEVYNAIGESYLKLGELIGQNSKEVPTEDGMYTNQIDEVTEIMRYMLINLTNIEDEKYWNSLDGFELEKLLSLAKGDFKKVVNELVDIIIEVGDDIRLQNQRELNMLLKKIDDFDKAIKYEKEIGNKLSSIGINEQSIKEITTLLNTKKEK